jgi:branched-chain amino acid transport system permease protein
MTTESTPAPTTRDATDATRVQDRTQVVYADWNRKHRAMIASLITDELIEEHRVRPLGQHSDDLERVLQYFRRQPQAGKYLGVMTRPWQDYRIGVISGKRGIAATILDDASWDSEDEVLHAIFLRRVSDLREQVAR